MRSTLESAAPRSAPRVLLLCAGRFGPEDRLSIAENRAPRLDVLELQDRLRADLLDFRAVDVERERNPIVAGLVKTAGLSAALAWIGCRRRADYDAVFTTGEDIGLPYAAFRKVRRGHRPRHVMIAHTLAPQKKQRMVRLLRLAGEVDSTLCYATVEQRLIESLGFADVQRIAFHADTEFFRPDPAVTPEPDLLSAAGQLLRDYDSLVEAVRPLPVRLQIAAGSPWIDQPLKPKQSLPANVTWGRLDRFALRNLYARSALCVVPIYENDYQTGISTILEMMAMGKCVVATRTRGQTDTIVDGENGVYVPPSDVGALRAAIERLLADPERMRAIGARAREYVLREAGIERFVDRLAAAITGNDGVTSARSACAGGCGCSVQSTCVSGESSEAGSRHG